MSKTIEDYRQIVKVLKLQLLKVRQENNSLSKTLGVSTESQATSFTPRLEKLKNSTQQFAKFLLLYNQFAHRCQLIGVTPEMVFRIADKKRDKKVAVSDLMEIMKRLKLKITQVDIQRLLQPISKSSNIHYQQYLEYLSAFQINSQPYPPNIQRTFSQISLLLLGKCGKQKDKSVETVFKQLTSKQGKPTISFKTFSQYCKSNTDLKDSHIIAAFVTLDAFSDCRVDRDTFQREMTKVYTLIDRGVQIQQQRPDGKATIAEQGSKRAKGKGQDAYDSRDEDEDVKLEVDTGVEKGNQKKGGKKQVKLTKGDLTKLIQQLKNTGISPNSLISKLLACQPANQPRPRPLALPIFSKTIQSISKTAQKKKILSFFKCLDTSYNGSISTDQLIKLWLEGRQISDSTQILYKLLARHFLDIQVHQFATRFRTCGYDGVDVVNFSVMQDVFKAMQLRDQYLQLIEKIIPPKCTVDKFVQLLESGGVPKPNTPFKPMKKSEFQNMNTIIKKLLPKQPKQFPKLIRQSDSEVKEWETIFTDEWACWNYCLETASKLTQNWKDPEFGPNKGDLHGFRSIVGNQSQIPDGLPMEEQIVWLSFQQMFDKENKPKEKIQLFTPNLTSNDIKQGSLGDCWLVSSLSIITSYDPFVKGESLEKCKKNPQLLTFGIHPIIFHMFRQYGLYVFKFYKTFEPIYVVVDALFPVNESNNELVFARSPDEGLQWVAFVEKAYAKLHHCYSNLISGDISQGLADLTNTLPIKETISNNNPEELLQKISKLNNENQLMGCSINLPPKARVEAPVTLDDQKTGLFYAHAYSVGDMIDLSKVSKEDYKLMRIRNPWGHGEWLLDWSDKPLNDDPDYQKLDKYLPDINRYYDEKIKLAKKNREDVEVVKYERKQDGEFLMNFYDFAKIYSNLFTGYSLKGKDFTCYSLQGKWDKATPSGLCKIKNATDAERTKFVKDNYQFILDVKQKTQIMMFLIQQDGRLFRGEKYPYKEICNGIIILSFNLSGNESMMDKFDATKMTTPSLKLELKRETNYWYKFEPGRYAIFPCKAGNTIPETKFDFRVYSDKRIDIRKIRGAAGTDFKILPKDGKQENQPSLNLLNSVLDMVEKASKEKL